MKRIRLEFLTTDQKNFISNLILRAKTAILTEMSEELLSELTYRAYQTLFQELVTNNQIVPRLTSLTLSKIDLSK